MRAAVLFSAVALAAQVLPGARSDLSCSMSSKNPCIWEISGASEAQHNGKIDVTSVFANGQLQVKNKFNMYYYHACSGIAACSGTCGVQGVCAACQKAGNDVYYGLGSIGTVSCDVSQSDPAKQVWALTLSYSGGTEQRRCDVTFSYSTSDAKPELTFDSEKPSLDYHMTVHAVFSVPVAPTSPVNPVNLDNIVGGILIGLLVLAAVGYIVIGVIVQAGVRKKRGREMIPNFAFWKDFPFLLKDGIVFTFTWPCTTLRNRH